uniref:Uncharacterized protein n=1 Tax=Cacopsylla melanoneura TaxID=428564 RepID=A0A8D8XNU2_9HEMI
MGGVCDAQQSRHLLQENQRRAPFTTVEDSDRGGSPSPASSETHPMGAVRMGPGPRVRTVRSQARHQHRSVQLRRPNAGPSAGPELLRGPLLDHRACAGRMHHRRDIRRTRGRTDISAVGARHRACLALSHRAVRVRAVADIASVANRRTWSDL